MFCVSQGERICPHLTSPRGRGISLLCVSQGERDEIALSLLRVRAVGIAIGVKGGDHIFRLGADAELAAPDAQA